MKDQKEVVDSLKEGGVLTRDLLKEVITFRVINGLRVRRFPLKLLEQMKEKDVVEIKDVVGLHSVYKLVKLKGKLV